VTADIVVVVGGGPAGSTCARRLADLGHRVRLVAAPARPRDDVEVLKPAIVERLRRAGVGGAVTTAGRPATGIGGAWGPDGAFDVPALLDPFGPGWIVDRPALDATLLEAAARAGVDVLDVPATACDETAGGRWRVAVGPGAPLTGRWLVDATGRAAWAARRHGERHGERLTATGRRYERSAGGDGPATLLVETVATGWWYSVPRADDDLVVVHVGLAAVGDTTWPELLRHAPLTAARIDGRRPAGARWVRAAGSARSVGGPPTLVAVGDALLAFDPVTGDGVSFAVVSGDEAALAIDAATTDATAIARYRHGAHLLFERYQRRRAALYRAATVEV
jgi:flavin-dependent dehydrogenase